MGKVLNIIKVTLICVCLGLCFFFADLAVYASSSIITVVPEQNISVYTSTQEVRFELSRTDSNKKENFICRIENADEKVVSQIEFSLNAGISKYKLDLGVWEPGWYRLRVFADENEVEEFISFSVIEQNMLGTPQEAFAIMYAGQYAGHTDEQKEKYARILSLIGAGTVRECAVWAENDEEYEVMEKSVDVLADEGLSVLETVDVPEEKIDSMGWDLDLFRVYNMQKGLSEYYRDRVQIWEIINEPDVIAGLSADLYTSFYKSAALGAEAGNPLSIKAFGGLCSVVPTFGNLMMQNDIMDYSDLFNVHTHATLSNVLSEQTFSSQLIQKAKIYNALYGENQPVWVTEAGIRLPVDENAIPDAVSMKKQAQYMVTSFIRSFADSGTDKHFWFLLRHYIENGREFGIFSDNDMPYPAVNTFAVLTKYLGDAIPVGKLKNTTQNIHGYVFDGGDSDVVVIWNSNSSIDYVQVSTQSDVLVADIFGGTQTRRYSANTGKVSIPVTQSPVLVCLDGHADAGDYDKKQIDRRTVNTKIHTDEERVILQQVWLDQPNVKNGEYILEKGRTYDIVCKVYNFNENAMRGTVQLVTSENIQPVGVVSKKFYAGENAAALSFSIKVSDNAEDYSQEYVSFRGVLDSGKSISACIAGLSIKSDLNISEVDLTTISGVYNRENWNIANRTGNSFCSVSTEEDSINFTLQFNGGDRFFYPQFSVSFDENSAGIFFNRIIYELTGNGNMKVFAWSVRGTFLAETGELSEGEAQYLLPWESFEPYGETQGELKPEEIYQIAIGYNAFDDNMVTYTINNLSSFKTNRNYENKEDEIIISGIEDNGIYTIGERLCMELQCLEAEKLSVYINYQETDKLEVISKNTAKLDLSELTSGSYSIIAAYETDFGKKIYKQISIYKRAADDYPVSGVFY